MAFSSASLHDGAGRQLRGVAAGLTLVVAVVVALVVVALAVVTGALVVAALVVTAAAVAAAVVGRARRGCGGRGRRRGVVALDLRVGVDRALDVVAVEEVFAAAAPTPAQAQYSGAPRTFLFNPALDVCIRDTAKFKKAPPYVIGFCQCRPRRQLARGRPALAGEGRA